jgi:hypothetical protein
MIYEWHFSYTPSAIINSQRLRNPGTRRGFLIYLDKPFRKNSLAVTHLDEDFAGTKIGKIMN